MIDGYFDVWVDFEAKDGPKIHAKLPDEIEKVTKVHMATTTNYSHTTEWENVAFFIETIERGEI